MAKVVPQKPAPTRDKLTKVIVAFFIVIALLFLIVGIYLSIQIHNIKQQAISPSAKPSLNMKLITQSALTYNNGTQTIPYALIGYNTTNATFASFYVAYLTSPPPAHIYILNWSNQCYNCGDITTVINSMQANLTKYGVTNTTGLPQIIPQFALPSITQGSILVILNGLMPDFMLAKYGQYPTLLQYLLSKGVTIIYTGRDFSRLISSQSVIIPDTPPGYLATGPVANRGIPAGFYFNASQATFSFSNSSSYGALTYESVFGGTIIAFSNYLNTWIRPSWAGSDIASTIFLNFWYPKVADGYAFIVPKNASKSSGSVGVSFSPLAGSYQAAASLVNSTYARVVGVSSANGKVSYTLFYYRPRIWSNGTFSMPGYIVPGQQFNATISVVIPQQQLVEPHIDLYTRNLTYITSLPPVFAKQLPPPSYTFLKTMRFLLPPGGYIAQLAGLQNQKYALSYFNVGNISIALPNPNLNASTFVFQIMSNGTPLDNITALVNVNGKYARASNISRGSLTYSLPQGTTLPKGNINFTIGMLNSNFTYKINYNPPILQINPQYIEFIIAIMIVILEITLIKAPIRDEFYVDVPSLPEPQKTSIKIKSSELLNVFDKLNLYYHWRYMPLSKTEFRFAVSNNVRSNNMPVTLTYNNIDAVLDGLTSRGYLLAADELYAPAQWIEQSKHDIEYLATFKKLRVYLVSHAHIFTDLGKSDQADIVTTLHNEKAFIVIYSRTSKFVKSLPVQKGVKTYLAFLNSDKMDEFRQNLYRSSSRDSEEMKMYISVGSVTLLDSDNPEGILS